jgi:hypothetical protein
MELEDEQALLYLDKRVVRGVLDPVPDDKPLVDRVSIGHPLAIPLTSETVATDPDLTTFIEAEAGSARYALVYLACTFKPARGERISKAWLSVKLALGPSAQDGDAAIAWSMEPMRTSKALNLRRTLSIKVPVKFVEVNAEAGSDVSAEAVFCEALDLQQSTPSWEFTDSQSQRLTGAHKMNLVIRAPLSEVTGTVSLRASVTRKHFGVLPYRTSADGGPALSFVV